MFISERGITGSEHKYGKVSLIAVDLGGTLQNASQHHLKHLQRTILNQISSDSVAEGLSLIKNERFLCYLEES